ncbi:hypothetical protein [Streptomyces sp. NPDC001502]|uniref:hypothetical protein n=1 Tax=Streptomyces sp. NPDC001502 TaxID=3364578 RepID=UPI00368E3B5D
MPLKLAKIGVPLAETTAEALAATGIDLAVQRPAFTPPEALTSSLPATGRDPDEYTAAEQPTKGLLDPTPRDLPVEDQADAEAAVDPEFMPVASADGEAYPFPGETTAAPGPATEPAPATAGVTDPLPAPSASANGDAPMRVVADGKRSAVPAPTSEDQPWPTEVADSGDVTPRVPPQQNTEPGADSIQQQIELVAGWLAEAEGTGVRLSGAETARRLGVSPKTGQRRVLEAAKYLKERGQQQGRARLRSVGG